MSKRHGRMMLAAVATLVLSFLGAGCGSGGPKLTPEQKTSATSYCQKGVTCGELTSSEVNQCVTMVAGAIQIFPDPDKFSACVNSLSCSALTSDDPQELVACMDLNRDSYVCSGSDTLTGCDNAGKCASASCSDICDLVGYTFDHCGASDDLKKAKNVCYCRA